MKWSQRGTAPITITKYLLSIAEYFCIAGFAFTSYRADRAMNKAGIGDLDLFAFWSRLTWLSVAVFLLLWMPATVVAVVKRQQGDYPSSTAYWKALLPDVILPPIFFIVFWVAYIFWI